MESGPTNFGARLRGLIANKGLSLTAFAKTYGIAESQLHNWLKRDTPPLPKHWPRLAEFFECSVQYIVSGTPEKEEPQVAEPPADYRKSGSQHASGVADRVPYSPTMLDPRFQPRAEPTLKMCIDYIAEYLRRANAQPGGIGYAWVKLQKNFPLDEFEPAETEPEPK